MLKILATKPLSEKIQVNKWAGLPPSATNALLHMLVGLGFKSISELYTEDTQ